MSPRAWSFEVPASLWHSAGAFSPCRNMSGVRCVRVVKVHLQLISLHQRLAGKTCIVTGSGGSIGRAAALRFSAEGAIRGRLRHRRSGRGRKTVRLVEEAGGTMISLHPADLTVKVECERLCRRRRVERFGGIDVLFNNGAMAYFAWIGEMSDDTWYKTINEELNLVFSSHSRRVAGADKE